MSKKTAAHGSTAYVEKTTSTDSLPDNAINRLIAAFGKKLINWRWPLGFVFALVTISLTISASGIRPDTSFTKFIPTNHPYMQAFMKHFDVFGGSNRILINVRWKGDGDIYNKEYLDVLRNVTDDVFFMDDEGVNRTQVTSLFTPNVMYIEVTEQGFLGEVIIPSNFTPNEAGLNHVRANVEKSGRIGSLVANDLKGAMVTAELMERRPDGKPIDYWSVSKRLEEVRAKYEQNPNISIEMVGFTPIVGAIADGFIGVFVFFGIAFLITAALLWYYSKSFKLTMVALFVALLPVLWLLGILPLIGYGIDPMSILVPFLIFSIGVSHAVQMTNAWKEEILLGASPLLASENSFRHLFIPGALALVTNALGFMVIMLIDIPVVHELGVTACLGVLLMIVTNKMILPIILSHLHIEKSAIQKKTDGGREPLWWWVASLAQPKAASVTILISLLLLGIGTWKSRDLLTGDVGSGAPELHADSRYNIDNDSITGSYGIGMDVLSTYIETKVPEGEEACLHWDVMNAVDRYDLHMSKVEGVQSVLSTAWISKIALAANNEGNPKWSHLQRSPIGLSTGVKAAQAQLGFNDESCETLHIMTFLKDHEAKTLKHVMNAAEDFIKAEPVSEKYTFRLAGGNAGVAAATNEAVEAAEVQMLGSIFGAIILLCLITFRSWRAVVCIILPLTVVSILCNALMATLGIGLKVATLPVIALGVGVGVDYGIYLYERLQHEIERNGRGLREAIYEAMRQRGTAAVFTAITMTIGVGTWAFSALKFQADMGILLAFMFLVNLFGAIFLLTAMAYWLDVASEEKDRHPA